MPMFIGLLIVLALFYQFCFRYETYENPKQPGVLLERDTLTGDERTLKPGGKVTLAGRIFGNQDSAGDSRYIQPWGSTPEGTAENIPDNAAESNSASIPNRVDSRIPLDAPVVAVSSLEPSRSQPLIAPEAYENAHGVEKIARPVPVPREVVVASSAPPVPSSGGMEGYNEGANTEANEVKLFAIRQVDLNKDGSTEEIIQNATQADGLLDISIVKNGREIFFGRGKQISLLPNRSQGWSDIMLKMGARTMQIFRYDPQEASYRALDSKS